MRVVGSSLGTALAWTPGVCWDQRGHRGTGFARCCLWAELWVQAGGRQPSAVGTPPSRVEKHAVFFPLDQFWAGKSKK